VSFLFENKSVFTSNVIKILKNCMLSGLFYPQHWFFGWELMKWYLSLIDGVVR